MNFFKRLFGKKNTPNFIVATLNDKIMPLDRGEVYEDPLDLIIQSEGIGEITGGGTLQSQSGEIEYCDIEIMLYKDSLNSDEINLIISKLEEFGAPKGSNLKIESTDETINFGKLEGLAIYLDGINLSDEVYEKSDSEAIAKKIMKLANTNDQIIRYWQGNTETALYFYGKSFNDMNESIKDFVSKDPECENARILQIA